MGVKKRMNMQILKRFGVSLLSAYENRLDEAVQNDYNLLERTLKHRPDIMDKADQYKTKFQPALRELTVQDVWDFMEDKKPGLYKSMNRDPETRQWADRELKVILRYLQD